MNSIKIRKHHRLRAADAADLECRISRFESAIHAQDGAILDVKRNRQGLGGDACFTASILYSLPLRNSALELAH